MTRSPDKVIDLVRVHLGSPSEAPEAPHAAADRESSGEAAEKPIPTWFQSAISRCNPARKSTRRKVPWPFFGPLGGANGAPPDGTKSALATHLGEKSPQAPSRGRGAETYVAPPSAGRRPPVGPPQVLPPAGPSHLTPSSPGEAKSRSREAPRCLNQPRPT